MASYLEKKYQQKMSTNSQSFSNKIFQTTLRQSEIPLEKLPDTVRFIIKLYYIDKQKLKKSL